MSEYHKIQTMYKRNMDLPRKPIIEGAWTTPELEYLANNRWSFTEKVDGTNIRVMYSGGAITFGGKTDSSQIPSFLVNKLNSRFLPMLPQFSNAFGSSSSVVLYFEGYGAKIQKGGENYRADQDVVLFDVKVGDWYLQRADLLDVASLLGLELVPVIGEGTLLDAVHLVKAGLLSVWGNFQAEGIVARPTVELKTRGGERIITKIKHRDFATAR